MRSFDKRYLQLVSKNFLRFWKGRGFKEVHMPLKISENTFSEFFLGRLRVQLVAPGDKLAKEFMNSFFNILNELTTELFVIFKELKNAYGPQILKKTRSNFVLVVDLFRIVEMLTRYAPEIFVDKQSVHSIRLLNYMMFVLHSVFVGELGAYIDYFSEKIQHRSETLSQFLAPFIGILRNLYEAANTLGTQDNAKYDNLADIFQKTDSFDPTLFLRLREVVKSQLPPASAEEAATYLAFESMIDEIEMLCQSNKIRKHSIKSQESEGEAGHTGQEDQIDEERVCNICYFTEKDSVFEPCGHMSCFKCI